MIKKILNWIDNPNVLATIKTLTYKVISGSTTFVIVYLFTGDVKTSGQSTVAMMIIHMGQYWVHERLWLTWENRKLKSSLISTT